ncbi:MAG TPA: SRPBCC family protein [Actinomycetota bacterium]|nr:SRPBCC family protein [Actinomycetota bacterium]
MTIEVAYAESIDIQAPIDKVFAHRLDFMNLPDYMTQAANIRRTDGGTEPGPGAEYAFDVTIPGMGAMEAYIKVLEVEAPSRIVFDTGSSGMGGREVSTFTELPDGGTHVEFAFSMSLPDAAAEGVSFVEDSGRSSFRGELDGLKRFFEGA